MVILREGNASLSLTPKESKKMQEMQEPQRRTYNEGYPEAGGYSADEEADWAQPQYDSQQKLQPERDVKLSTTNYVLAILSTVASQIIMFLSFAVFALTANIFGRTVGAGATSGLPGGLTGVIIGGFVVSLILLLFSITGFILSVTQIAIIQKKRNQAREAGRSRYR